MWIASDNKFKCAQATATASTEDGPQTQQLQKEIDKLEVDIKGRLHLMQCPTTFYKLTIQAQRVTTSIEQV
jgi:hypothetical protein